ncbi:MAG: ribonuclease III [Chloroflexi bacterium]|nr:ribonuclease III [Chloroflexota bacterium]
MVELHEIEERLGISFASKDLLRQAFVHRSYLNEDPYFPLTSNERLEFLGDSVLGFVVTQELFERFPLMSEGQLSHIRTALIRGETLARWATSLSLGSFLLLSRGEDSSGGRERPTNLACAFEALVGAIFVDQGLPTVQSFLNRFIHQELGKALDQIVTKDPKSRLQEMTQRKWQLTPSYRTASTAGPNHARLFTIEVVAGETVLGRGQGRSKQAAAQEAARLALESLTEIDKIS